MQNSLSPCLFTWHDYVFNVFIDGTKLCLKWKSISSLSTSIKSKNDCDSDGDSGQSESNTTKREHFAATRANHKKSDKNKRKSSKKKAINYNFSESSSSESGEDADSNVNRINVDENATQCEFKDNCELDLITIDETFDPILYEKVPVCVLKYGEKVQLKTKKSKKAAKDKDNPCKNYFVLIRIEDNENIINVGSEEKCPSHCTKRFQLTEIRKYEINNEASHCDLDIKPNKNLLFLLNNYALVFIDKRGGTLKLFLQGNREETPSIQHIKYEKDACSQQTVIDVYSSPVECTFLLLTGREEEYSSFYFFPKKVDDYKDPTNTIIPMNHDVLPVPITTFFSEDFYEILLEVKILSFSRQCLENSVSLLSSLIMITKTGFAVQFVNGSLHVCVNLSLDSLSSGVGTTLDPNDENLCGSLVEVLHFDDQPICTPRSTVLFLSQCFLIDWDAGKISTSWSSVSKVLKWNSKSGGDQLIVIYEPKQHSAPATYLQDVSWEVIDLNHSTNIVEDKLGGEGSSEEEYQQYPKCAVDALLAQEKMCFSAIKDADSILQRKKDFITEVWEQLSQMQLGGSYSQPQQSKMPPLVPVIEGSVSGRFLQGQCQSSQTSQPEVSHIWKRFVDSDLVVGVEFRNRHSSCLHNISLSLMSTSQNHHDHPSVFTSTHLVLSGSTQHRQPELQSAHKKPRVDRGSDHYAGLSELDAALMNNLNPGSLEPSAAATLTCSAPLQEVVSGGDVRLLVFVTYIVRCEQEVIMMGGGDGGGSRERRINYCCGEVIITSKDLLGKRDILSDRSAEFGDEVTLQSLQTLTTVQTPATLRVQSEVTSVLALTTRVRAHPALRPVPWADQYVCTQDSVVRHCRLRILPQISRHLGHVQVFARSDQQTLLFVHFLYSLLPGDIKLLPFDPSKLLQQQTSSVVDPNNLSATTSSSREKVLQTTKSLLTHVDTLLSDIQHRLSAVEGGGGDDDDPDLFEDSPPLKDLKHKRVNVKQSQDSKMKHEQVASSSKQNNGPDLEEERLQVKRARKRVKKKMQEYEQNQS